MVGGRRVGTLGAVSLVTFEKFRPVAVITLNLRVGVLAATLAEPRPASREGVAAFERRKL